MPDSLDLRSAVTAIRDCPDPAAAWRWAVARGLAPDASSGIVRRFAQRLRCYDCGDVVEMCAGCADCRGTNTLVRDGAATGAPPTLDDVVAFVSSPDRFAAAEALALAVDERLAPWSGCAPTRAITWVFGSPEPPTDDYDARWWYAPHPGVQGIAYPPAELDVIIAALGRSSFELRARARDDQWVSGMLDAWTAAAQAGERVRPGRGVPSRWSIGRSRRWRARSHRTSTRARTG